MGDNNYFGQWVPRINGGTRTRVSGKDDDGRKTQGKMVAKAATPL